MSVLIFFAVLFLLILVHEWGHFIVAKKTGMRVDEFGIGFPPKIKGFKKGETEYTLNWLPIGGFVKIWGENYEEEFSPVESEAIDRRSEATAEAGEGGTKVVGLKATAEAGEGRTKVVGLKATAEAGEGGTKNVDNSRAFSNRPKWAQALVLVAGVTMNVLFAWFLFSLTFMIGVQTPVEEGVATEEAKLYLTSVVPDSPATVIPVGAEITKAESGERVVADPTPTEFRNLVMEVAPEAITVSYLEGEDVSSAEIVPVQGLDDADPERYAIGAALVLVEMQSKPFFTAIIDGAITTWYGLAAITSGLWTLISQAVVGEADMSQVAGPVGIVGMVGEAASYGWTALLTFTAIISLNLAIINLLPMPALDGGRLVFVAIEAVIRRPIPPVWAGRVNLVGFALLMLLMVAVTYNDILRLL